MTWKLYRAGRVVTRFIFFCTMRLRALRRGLPDRQQGGYVLAVSHQGHLDPFLASTIQDRPVVWITRKEFYASAISRWLLRQMNAIRVNRQGVPVSTLRAAIRLARDGHAIGICPEGGVAGGDEACFRGGTIKRGVASIAIHAQVPIIPCLIVGSARLSDISPWLPAKRGKLWVAYGDPIPPDAHRSTRETRRALAGRLEAAFVALYDELDSTFDVDPAWVA